MPVDAEIVEGGIWLRITGQITLDEAHQACLAAIRSKDFVPGGRMLVDGRDGIAPDTSPEELKELVRSRIPAILEAIPHWGILTSDVEHWGLARELIRRSGELEDVEFFSDLPAGLRWLTGTA